MSYFIYILECVNDALYTGYTVDMRRRYLSHLRGSASCKYTRSFPPKRLAACWEIRGELGLVLQIERQIKCYKRVVKLALIEKPEALKQKLMESKLDISSATFLPVPLQREPLWDEGQR